MITARTIHVPRRRIKEPGVVEGLAGSVVPGPVALWMLYAIVLSSRPIQTSWVIVAGVGTWVASTTCAKTAVGISLARAAKPRNADGAVGPPTLVLSLSLLS
jgi:uncharacterized BrkB/YihY/UPF0761 family membrane protein